ncbi:MAG TPA: hypothetical protein PLA11_15995, partial [Flavobacteriales bacterium]|nr:hypothetical protein [Flavobacteriales bacterium]
TGVQFAGTDLTVIETAGTADLTLSITDPSGSQATSVDVVLISGDPARINNYTTQTVSWVAGDGTDKTLTLTITDDLDCLGQEDLVFEIQNLTGGQGTPFIGSPSQRNVTITDNEFANGVVIARQGFEGSGADNWTLQIGASRISADPGAGDTPANSRIRSGNRSWQYIGTSSNLAVDLQLASVDVTGFVDLEVEIRISSTSTSTGNGLDENDTLRFYLDVDNAGYPAVPDVEIRGGTNSMSNVRYDYAATGVVSTTAGAPVVVTNPTDDTTTDGYALVRISVPDGSSSVALRADVRVGNSSNEVLNIDDIVLLASECRQTWYSRGNGSEADNIWSLTPGGTAGPATWGTGASMVVQNGNAVVTTGADLELRNLTVDNGGSLDLTGPMQLDLFGNALTNNGTLDALDATVVLNRDELVALAGTGDLDLGSLQVDDLTGAQVTADTLKVRSELILNAGDFDANGKEVVLVSDAAGTARLAPVNAAASYTGFLRQQRYIPAGVT